VHKYKCIQCIYCYGNKCERDAIETGAGEGVRWKDLATCKGLVKSEDAEAVLARAKKASVVFREIEKQADK
jgi:hypothetical protein